eukprot:TRINITY_DN14996_c0_g1_i1.p1 TRINITY_DN14996_c0_g1~~TRINITY_DN14996_c0_g1_i1.p1  ORF type:complete len:1018 (+),score=209.81 TRINITY_DN14996_c0_g1_i1:71-3124(+)
MPLCAPKKVPLLAEDWLTTRTDAAFVLQKRPISLKNKKEAFRILLRCNKFVIGEFSEEKEALRMWDHLHEADPVGFDASGEVAVQQMLQLKMASMGATSSSAEDEFQEQSNYMAAIMTIVEITKSLPERAELADLRDAATMASLLSTISSQLAASAKQLVERRIISKRLGISLHASLLDNWVELSTTEEAASSTKSDDPAPSDPASLTSNEKEQVAGLVEAVNKLYEFTTKRASSTDKLLQELDSVVKSADSISDVLVGSVFYIPIVDRTAKAQDSAWVQQMIDEKRNGSTLSDLEYETEISTYLYSRVAAGADSNPLAKALTGAINKYALFLANLKNSASYAELNEESLSNFMQNLRSDIYQFSELLAIGFKLSFPAVYQETYFFNMFKRSVRDVVISQLHPFLSQMYRTKLVSKDDMMKAQCATLRDAPADVSGVDPKFVGIVSSEGGLDATEECAKIFSESTSVRQKLHHLEALSTSLFSLAAQQLKKLALDKKRPGGSGDSPGDSPNLSSSSSSLSISTVDDVMKYSIGADDFLPLLTYALIQLDVQYFYSDLLFIADFIDESMLLGKAGYLLASAQTAIQYILSLNYEPNPPSPSSISSVDIAQDAPAAESKQLTPPAEAPPSPATPSRKSFFSSKRDSGKKQQTPVSTPTKSTQAPDPASPESIPPQDKENWVLNTFIPYTGDVLEADLAYHHSQRLYSLIISIYHRFKSTLSGPLQPGTKRSQVLEQARTSMRTDEIYAAFRIETTKLQQVSVDSLHGKERMVFFLNVYHALILHGGIEREWPDSDLSRLRMYQRLAYNIGGVTCSLLEIEHGILRYKTSAPDILPMSLVVKRYKNADWGKKDYSLDFAEPLLSFIISTVSVSGAPLRVYHADPSLDQTIAYAAAAYLDREVILDEERGEIQLPRVLEWYKKDFGRNNLEVLQYVARWLPKPSADRLNSYAAKKKMNNIKVKYRPYSWEFKFEFLAPPEDSMLEAGLPACWNELRLNGTAAAVGRSSSSSSMNAVPPSPK